MGGSSSGTQATTQTATTTPAPAYSPYLSSSLKGIQSLSQPTTAEQAAFSGLESPQASGILSGYLPQQQNFAQTLYGGGGDFSAPLVNSYNSYVNNVSPLANASVNPYETPGFSDAMNTLRNDAYNQIAGSYAGAGRDPSGAGNFAQTFGRGVTQGAAPTIAAQYNANINNLLNANSGLLGAGYNTAQGLQGLQQTRFGNMAGGLEAAQGAQGAANSPFLQQLQAEAAKRGISMDAYLAQAGIALPASQAFGTTTTTGTGNQQQQMSGAQQFALISQGVKNLSGPLGQGAGALKGLLG